MTKSIFEQLGGAYEQQGDYLLPCLTVPAENEQPIGVWGQRHLRYLKEYRRAAYITLLTSGRLNAYLADIDRQAQERMERLTEQMKQAQGITEQLKAENALEWVQRMNNIRACAREKEDFVEFYVKDSGIGIPAERVATIFQRFGKINDFVQGTGLGLTLCRMLVEKMGGRIWLRSQEGKGSRFYFTLPLIRQ